MKVERRAEIQWLRGLAATEVVFCHSDLVTKHFTDFRIAAVHWYQPFLGIGVEVFFMVSGYIICMRAASHPTGSAFLFSRVRRLFPMYWIFSTLVLLAFVANPAWRLNNFELTPLVLLQSYLILPQWEFPILGVGWTLEHEMVFYGLVALMMAFTRPTGLPKYALPWLLGIFGLIGCMNGYPGPGQGGPELGMSLWAAHLFSPYMLAFGFGWLVRCAEEMTPVRGAWTIALYFGLGLVAYLLSTGHGTVLGLRLAVAATIFGGFIACRRLFEADNLVNRLGWKFGDASFGVYLSHWFILSAIGKVLGVLDVPSAASGLVRVLAIGLCVAIGLASFAYLEQPLDRWLRRRGTSPAGSGFGNVFQKRAWSLISSAGRRMR